ncbi:unnamed protein product [Closterium sp. NIES-65]|nr:unnamed protein product [Closterium sp. NIES-65]
MAGSIVNIPGITSNGSTAALFHLILPQRYVIVLLTLVCSAVCYIERVGFSIAYTAIAIREGVDQATKGWVMSAFYYGYASSQGVDQATKGWVMSAFYYGYASSQAAGRLKCTAAGSFVACPAAPYSHLIFPVLSASPTLLSLTPRSQAVGLLKINHMDIAPRFAGVVMGVSNTAGTMAGVVGVAASGLILEAFSGGEGSGGVGNGGVGGVSGVGGAGGGRGVGGIDPGWWWVFFTPASLCVVSALIFDAFATGERVFE